MNHQPVDDKNRRAHPEDGVQGGTPSSEPGLAEADIERADRTRKSHGGDQAPVEPAQALIAREPVVDCGHAGAPHEDEDADVVELDPEAGDSGAVVPDDVASAAVRTRSARCGMDGLLTRLRVRSKSPRPDSRYSEPKHHSSLPMSIP